MTGPEKPKRGRGRPPKNGNVNSKAARDARAAARAGKTPASNAEKATPKMEQHFCENCEAPATPTTLTKGNHARVVVVCESTVCMDAITDAFDLYVAGQDNLAPADLSCMHCKKPGARHGWGRDAFGTNIVACGLQCAAAVNQASEFAVGKDLDREPPIIDPAAELAGMLPPAAAMILGRNKADHWRELPDGINVGRSPGNARPLKSLVGIFYESGYFPNLTPAQMAFQILAGEFLAAGPVQAMLDLVVTAPTDNEPVRVKWRPWDEMTDPTRPNLVSETIKQTFQAPDAGVVVPINKGDRIEVTPAADILTPGERAYMGEAIGHEKVSEILDPDLENIGDTVKARLQPALQKAFDESGPGAIGRVVGEPPPAPDEYCGVCEHVRGNHRFGADECGVNKCPCKGFIAKEPPEHEWAKRSVISADLECGFCTHQGRVHFAKSEQGGNGCSYHGCPCKAFMLPPSGTEAPETTENATTAAQDAGPGPTDASGNPENDVTAGDTAETVVEGLDALEVAERVLGVKIVDDPAALADALTDFAISGDPSGLLEANAADDVDRSTPKPTPPADENQLPGFWRSQIEALLTETGYEVEQINAKLATFDAANVAKKRANYDSVVNWYNGKVAELRKIIDTALEDDGKHTDEAKRGFYLYADVSTDPAAWTYTDAKRAFDELAGFGAINSPMSA